MKIIPRENNVLLEKVKDIHEEVNRNGIILPKKEPSRKLMATVLAISKDVISPEISIGDTVLFSKFCGENYGETMLIDYDDIICILEVK